MIEARDEYVFKCVSSMNSIYSVTETLGKYTYEVQDVSDASIASYLVHLKFEDSLGHLI